MIDKFLLFPYWLALKTRHLMFDCGLRKVHTTEVPSICVGNITVGGTGKTPHTEMILRLLLEDQDWGNKDIAVLSRGYKRKSKGFQQVTANGTGMVTALSIDAAVVDPDDVEFLQSLLLKTVQDALNGSKEMAEKEMRKVTGGLGFPM